MNDKLSLIREKCIAANPEIVELEFGCEVDGNIGMVEYLNDPFVVVGQTSVCKKHKKYHEECGAEENGCAVSAAVVVKSGNEEGWGTHTAKDFGKILGRPIRLADVLLAYIHYSNPARVVIDANRHLDTELKIMMMWNLRADDLEKQSEETINFLYELLK